MGMGYLRSQAACSRLVVKVSDQILLKGRLLKDT